MYDLRVFSHGMGKAPDTLILGKNPRGFTPKGKENPEVNLILGENCMKLKKFAEGKTPINGPYYLRKKSPVYG